MIFFSFFDIEKKINYFNHVIYQKVTEMYTENWARVLWWKCVSYVRPVEPWVNRISLLIWNQKNLAFFSNVFFSIVRNPLHG